MNYTTDCSCPLPSAMTSDECIDILNNSKEDPFFYLSLAINGLLLVTTAVSEMMSASKCKSNSIIEFIINLAKGKECKKNIDNNINDGEEDTDQLATV